MPIFQKFSQLPPLSLYIHIPWCVRKCPYCDFNSHQADSKLPIAAYLEALKLDLYSDIELAQGRQIESIFFGGGTPSLMPASFISEIICYADQHVGLSPSCEITLEANPGTAEYDNFKDYRLGGVNRLSIGVQSFNDQQLRTLGRIHSSKEVVSAFELARQAGFDNINLDLMFGLPGQTTAQAQQDLNSAIALTPEHISWYQLTIETNTEFYSRPPQLPEEDSIWQIQQQGQQLLASSDYRQYEISAYAKPGKQAQHNLNYWQFGDYLAIGAGAHGKITQLDQQQIWRKRKTRLPNHYLDAAQKGLKSPVEGENAFDAENQRLCIDAIPFEFMMNALRLVNGVPASYFSQRTGLELPLIEAKLQQQRALGLLSTTTNRLCASTKGHQFLNNLLEGFL